VLTMRLTQNVVLDAHKKDSGATAPQYINLHQQVTCAARMPSGNRQPHPCAASRQSKQPPVQPAASDLPSAPQRSQPPEQAAACAPSRQRSAGQPPVQPPDSLSSSRPACSQHPSAPLPARWQRWRIERKNLFDLKKELFRSF